MSIFGKIKSAIFGDKGPLGGALGGHHDTAPAPRPAGPAQPQAMPQMGQPAQAHLQATATPPATAQPAAQPVDVEAVLADRARAKGGAELNWRSSIVDLMKLLDLDSSLDNRKELATELGYQGAKDGSADMNTWLHKAVMRELAKNGGKVPAALTD